MRRLAALFIATLALLGATATAVAQDRTSLCVYVPPSSLSCERREGGFPPEVQGRVLAPEIAPTLTLPPTDR